MGCEIDGFEISQCIDKLENLLKQKEEYLNNILSITLKQSDAISNYHIDNLLEYFDDRQKYIDKINEIDRNYSRVYDEIVPLVDLDNLVVLKDRAAAIKKLLNEIYDKDKKNNEQMENLVFKYKGEIKKINNAHRTYDAYKGQSVLNDGIFIDKKQ